MGTNLRAAAIKALEFLSHDMVAEDWPHQKRKDAICDALRAALAEPEQEPVAWYFARDSEKAISFAPDNDPAKPWQPLYTAPPEAVEPIAWMVYTEGGASAYVTDSPNDLVGAYRALPLYTAPTPRKPLTDEEIDKLPWGPHEGNPVTFAEGLRDFARAIESAHGIGGGE